MARAPGRLDVMGGIADYSGSLVLELPLDRFVTVTIDAPTDRRTDAPRFEVTSHRDGRDESFAWQVGAPIPREPSWASYVAGVIGWVYEQSGASVRRSVGASIHITSTVPEGKGVASSAALEVACMKAVCKHWGIEIPPQEMAAACQWVENHVVGAPCGIMDQMTSACGEPRKLLQLRCQPATIEGFIPVPAGYSFFGIDSGIRHAVTGADYGTVRAATFMGLRIITEMDPHAVPGGYLANMTPERFARFENMLPDRMAGADFLHMHSGISDTVTSVAHNQLYPVQQATRHAVMENARVERFVTLLGELPSRGPAAEEMGELMYAAHRSYGGCGLGSDGTDRLVELVHEVGPAGGLFGAKITGGGSGGTVAVFARASSESAVRRIAARYADETRRTAEVFTA